VVDSAGVIKHAEYVREVPNHPDYDKAIAALKAL
jgi:peroxiredoxin